MKILPIIVITSALAGITSRLIEAAPPPTVTNVLVFGDSLSDGFGLSRDQAYPALLVKKAQAAGYRVQITNASASGGTTEGGLQRLPNHLARRIDVLLVELGINDAFRGVPVEEIGASLQTIIDRTKARYPKVEIMIAGMQLPASGADDYVKAFSEMFGALAEKNHAALIPYLLAGVAGDPSLNLADRIHPNAAGQRILSENVWRVLEPVLQKIASAHPAAHVE